MAGPSRSASSCDQNSIEYWRPSETVPQPPCRPRRIAVHPFAGQHLEIVAVEEGALKLTLVALARADTAIKPSVRHFLAHLHRAAHHLTSGAAG